MAQNPSSRAPKSPPLPANDLNVARWTKWLAFATIALAVCTAALVATGIFAIVAADEQSAISSKTEIDAQTQNRIASLAQSDTRERLRAVLDFAGISLSPGVNPDTKEPGYTTAVNIRNSGGTRTAHFSAWASSHFFEKEVPDSWDFSKPIKALPTNETTVGANGFTQLPVGFSANELNKSANGQGSAIVWGLARYSDIFNPDVYHDVSYCFNINPSSINGTLVFNPFPFRPTCNYSR